MQMTKSIIPILALLFASCLQPVSAITPPATLTQSVVQSARQAGASTRLPVDEQTPTPTPAPRWIVCAEKLYVRSGPSMNNAAIRYLKRGEVVSVQAWSANGWAMIAPTEWVNGDYLCEVDK
jgi:uncharacterized protein YgiM (DUF1202 family)